VKQIPASVGADAPSRNCTQAIAPEYEYVPAGQKEQEVAPKVDDSPFALQIVPLLPEYVPAGHAVQEEAPPVEEYVPAGHAVHEEAPELEYWPGRHDMQEAVLLEMALEYVPTGHGVHFF